MTILRHEPAGTGFLPHFDLLVEPGSAEIDDETRDVPTWRCPRRPDRLEVGLDFRAAPIAPHRRWWLSRPIGESVELTPPNGIARVIARGRLQDAREADRAVTDLIIEWEPVPGTGHSPDSGGTGIRIESLDDALVRIECRRFPMSTDRCCPPGAGTCC